MAGPAHELHSYGAYLRLEEETGLKHEFLDGFVFAMAGGTPGHADLQGQAFAILRERLQPRGCRAYPSDLKLSVSATGLATYADVTVVCGGLQRDPRDPNAVTNPSVLVEVLAPATEAYDRGEKFEHYGRIPALQDYLLVSTDRVAVEHRWRDDRGEWKLRHAGPGDRLTLRTHGAEIGVDELYEGVVLEPRPRRDRRRKRLPEAS